MALVAHLRDELGIFLRRLAQHAGFMHRPGERLFAVNVLAVFQRRLGSNGADVIRSSHDYPVDVFLLVEHFAEIGVAFRLAVSLLQLDSGGVRTTVTSFSSLRHGPIHVTEIYIGQRDDVLAADYELGRVGRALTAAAN